MWRTFFVAIGVVLLILGLESMVLDRASLEDQFSEVVVPEYDPLVDSTPPEPFKKQRVISPPEWAPYSLISASAVILLYAFTLRRGG